MCVDDKSGEAYCYNDVLQCQRRSYVNNPSIIKSEGLHL